MYLHRRITLRQLEVFTHAARHGTFARAAEALHLTPPAVSMQIRQLEEAAGLPLFERSGRRTVLTEAGERLLEHASRMLGELEDAEQSFAAIKGLSAGTVVVGLVSTAKYFTPKLLALFGAQHPAVEVRLVVGNRQTLVELLKDNRIHLAVMGRPPAELATVWEPLADNPQLIVAPATHALRDERHIDIQALRAETILQREPGSGTRSMMEELFRAQRFTPAKLLTLGSNETVKQAVMAGLGISVLSLHTLSLELRAGEIAVLDVTGTPLIRTWHVVHLRRRRLSPAAEAFRRFLIAETRGYLNATYGFAGAHAAEPA